MRNVQVDDDDVETVAESGQGRAPDQMPQDAVVWAGRADNPATLGREGIPIGLPLS